MNYQVFPLFFMRVVTLLFFLIAVGLHFVGISALVSYFVLVGVLFPVVISMRLHTLSESGQALILSENSQWTIYIHGFPAQEQRSVLKNPCFFSHARLRRFFIVSFVGKLCLQIACIAILACDYSHGANTLAAVFTLVCLLIFIGSSAGTLYRVIANQWQCENLTTNTGTVWYQGFMQNGDKKIAMLSRLQ